MTAGGDSVTIDISDHFTNGDTNGVEYSIDRNTQSNVKLSLVGTMLTIKPLLAGDTGKIIVRAEKDGCTDATQEFNVEVEPCPSISASIPAQNLVVSGDGASIELASYFGGLSGSTITATSSDSTVASASLSGTALAIAPKGEGTATVTVTVTVSKQNCKVMQTISVKVTEPLSCPLEDTLNAIVVERMTAGGDSVTIDVSDHFTNGDADGVEYSIDTNTQRNVTLSLVGTMLTIKPLVAGDTGKIIVRAEKAECTDATQEFNVEVEPCPSISASIPAQNLVVGGNSAMISLSSYFDDLSGSKITATSSDGTVASASLLGTELTIAPGVEGSETVTVTVSKDGCPAVEQSISVTVTPCPLLQSAIEDQMLMIGNDPLKIDLSEHFAIPTDFDPGFTVSSSDAEVATEGLEGNILTVTPVAVGTDTITVTATKTGCDGSVVDEFVVTVLPPCPAVITDSPVPDQVLSIIAGPVTIDLTRYFEYIDHEDTRITVTSPDPAVAVVNLDSTVITIEPKMAGSLEAVVVSAGRGECVMVTQSFMVTVEDFPGGIWSVSPEGDVYRLEGNVGIGLSSPDQKLVVDGKIKAEEVYLSMIPADYVFEDGYSLMSLEEVAEFIAARGHLPGIASGAEMKARGVGVSEMQTLLLEKIEEVSLYVIAQHEELRAHEDHIAAQHRRLEQRGQQIRQLESRMERLERE